MTYTALITTIILLLIPRLRADEDHSVLKSYGVDISKGVTVSNPSFNEDNAIYYDNKKDSNTVPADKELLGPVSMNNKKQSKSNIQKKSSTRVKSKKANKASIAKKKANTNTVKITSDSSLENICLQMANAQSKGQNSLKNQKSSTSKKNSQSSLRSSNNKNSARSDKDLLVLKQKMANTKLAILGKNSKK